MLRNKTFPLEFCSLISNWFDMREQAPGANLLHDSVSGASSLVCTEICFAGTCFRSKLPHVYWLGYLTRERVSRECFRSKLLRVYWLENLPGSVFRERVSGASSLVCTGLKGVWPQKVHRGSFCNIFSARPQDRILVPARGSFQNFQALSVLFIRFPPPREM